MLPWLAEHTKKLITVTQKYFTSLYARHNGRDSDKKKPVTSVSLPVSSLDCSTASSATSTSLVTSLLKWQDKATIHCIPHHGTPFTVHSSSLSDHCRLGQNPTNAIKQGCYTTHNTAVILLLQHHAATRPITGKHEVIQLRKPELCNVLQLHRSMEDLEKFGSVVLEIWMQTDKQTDTLITILRTPTGRSNNSILTQTQSYASLTAVFVINLFSFNLSLNLFQICESIPDRSKLFQSSLPSSYRV